MSKEIDEAVQEYLTSMFVEYVCTYAGETKRDTWECDAWNIVFKGPEKKRIETKFYTGLGLRGKPQANLGPRYREGTLAWEAWQKTRKPIKPAAASVLYSLMRDGEAIDMSFTNWCSDFGYEEDSIKALNLYTACCESGKKLNAFFNREQQEKLKKLLEDY